MPIDRRQFTASLAASALAGFPGISSAQDKRLRVLVGFAAGGAADTVARAVGEGLRESGYTVIVDNKAGAGGRLATEALLSLPPDGNTLLMTPLGNLSLFPHVFKSLRYEPLKDFAAVGTVSSMSFALAVGGSISAEHGIGVIKKELLHFTRSDAELELMRSLKALLDPAGILNAGRIFTPTTSV